MTGRVHKARASIHRPTQVHQDESKQPKRSSDALRRDLDDILDDIDAVLEENAEEFVKGFVQKGGE
jgi:ubiquitin-like protein Pup